MLMKKEAILITGCAGFIGSRFAEYLLEYHKEYKIIGIDNMFGGYIENVPKEVKFYNYDLSTCDLNEIFENNDIEYVFHFAAYAAEGLSPFIRKFNYKNNVIATANIINACIKYNVNRLVFTSSMSVYGHGSHDKYFLETDIPEPIDPYGVAKYACEMDIKIAGDQHGLDWCIIRPHNVFGIKQNIWDKYRNVIGIWMYNILKNKPITIYGDGEQTRAFTYIDNILENLWNAAVYKKASKQIINLGGLKEYSLNDTADILSNITGYNYKVYLEPRHEVKFTHPVPDKSIQILDYKETISVEEGISRMWKWAKNQPDRDQYKWPFYEIDKNLYSYWK